MAKVLIVDDEPAICQVLTTLLKQNGHAALQALDARQGLALFLDQQPDAIIVDLVMPEMDGFGFIRQLRNSPAGKSIPIIFHTAIGLDQTLRDLAYACGVDAIVAKPARPGAIIEAVENALKASPSIARDLAHPESFERRRLELLNNTLATKVRELEAANRRLGEEVAERKRSEIALQENHALLRTVIDSIPDAVFVKDYQGRYVMLNAEGARQVGRAIGEILGHDDETLFVPETARRFQESDRRIMATGVMETYEETGTAEGVTRNYLTTKAPYRNAQNQVLGVVGISRDITQAVRLQTECDELVARLRLQIERLPLGYLLLDAGFRLIEWNPAAEQIFGYTRSEVLGRRPFKLIIDLPLEAAVEDIVQRLVRGDMAAHSVNRNRTKDGRAILCEWFNTPLQDAQGAFAGCISVVKDVTAREQAKETLRETAERLRLVSRQVIEIQENERRHLARELHDEIGQVFCAVSTNLKMLRGKAQASAWPRLDESIGLVDRAIDQVRNLSLDLRPSMLDDFGLEAALRWYLDRLAQRAGLAPHFESDFTLVELPYTVRNACFRVAQESLTNVVRHARATSVWLSLGGDENEVRLEIRDDGVGFDTAQARQHAMRGGSLGLLGMQERIELLGGQVHLESSPGQGTKVTVRLPLTGFAGGKEAAAEV